MLMDKKYLIVGGGIAVLAIIAVIAKFKNSDGIIGGVAEAAGGAVVDAATGVSKGVINGVSKGIGIRGLNETITDPIECKKYIDANGWWDGSQACSLPAYYEAMKM